MRGMTRERIVGAAARAARRHKGALTLKVLRRVAGVSPTQVYYHWPEGLYGVLREAGVLSRAARRPPVPRRELMANLDRVVRHLGRLPTWPELRLCGEVSPSVYVDRFGAMAGVRGAYRRWCGRHRVDRVPPARPAGRAGRGVERTRRDGPEAFGCPATIFPGVGTEPVNEMGVVHLFGALSHRLGFVLLRIGRGFPDALALRRHDDGLWRRCRIEFEFRARGFALHKHPARECDLIVCWEDDWPGAPVEVLPLKLLAGTRVARAGEQAGGVMLAARGDGRPGAKRPWRCARFRRGALCAPSRERLRAADEEPRSRRR
jgi:AcrR family transcriptional regulator